MSALAPPLTPQRRELVKQAYTALDKDKNGQACSTALNIHLQPLDVTHCMCALCQVQANALCGLFCCN
jgi:hypothetical protein